MNSNTFRKEAHKLVDWMADYLEQIEQYPVKSRVKPREIYNRLEALPPEEGESMQHIFEDFREKIIPGITHWQHPNFHAYFPGNSSYPSILAEMLTATLGAQCMLWDTSPAAAELEEKMMEWLQRLLGLPLNWAGTIHDTASSATLVAILTAREQHSRYAINKKGFEGAARLRIYCSVETHSSIEKAVKIAGIGAENLVKIRVDEKRALRPDLLETAIKSDLENGYVPLCVAATLGTTGTTAIDPVAPIGKICKKHGIWLHIDAAYAGTALVLEEYRWMIKGIEHADSFVVNPHKWMFTNFDCTAYFVKDKNALLTTFEILPEYLKTRVDTKVNNYRDWGIPLGRRFRALKLWFVIRTYGVSGIQQRIREHITMARNLARKIENHPGFELLAPVNFNLICFRYNPGTGDETRCNAQNEKLLHRLNDSGQIYLTHTKIGESYVLRMVIGQTYVQQHHIDKAWALIRKFAATLQEEE